MSLLGFLLVRTNIHHFSNFINIKLTRIELIISMCAFLLIVNALSFVCLKARVTASVLMRDARFGRL